MAVLGGMLMSKDAIGEVSQTIDVTDFYQPKHQTIYNAIIDLFSASQPVDVVLVANQLLADGQPRQGSAARTICTALSHPYRPPLMPCTTRRSSISGPFCAM